MKYTYLFYRASDGLTKIGKTSFPSQRFQQLGGEKNLKVIAVIEGDYEKAMHERFDKFRVTGEWFELSDEILGSYSILYSKTLPIKEFEHLRNNVDNADEAIMVRVDLSKMLNSEELLIFRQQAGWEGRTVREHFLAITLGQKTSAA